MAVDEEVALNELFDRLFNDVGRVPSVEEINQSSKETLLQPYACGCTALRHAVHRRNGVSADVVSLLIERAPEALAIPKDKKGTIICSLGAGTDEEAAVLVAEHTPTTVLAEVGDKGDTALHHLIRKRVSQKVLQIAIKRSPPKVFATANDHERLPIHEATRAGVSLESFQLLLEYSPVYALGIPDNEGKLPLHALSALTSREVVKLLISNSPHWSLSRPDNQGRLPLQCAVSIGVPLEAIEPLIEHASSEILSWTDQDGGNLLHYLSLNTHVDVVLLLTRKAPELLRSADHDGRLPLHRAIIGSLPPETVQVLVDQCSKSLLVADKKGRLPLHLLSRKTPTAVIQLLIDHSSSEAALLTADLNGQLPVHHVIENHASIEAIRLLMDRSPEALLHSDKDDVLVLSSVVQKMLASSWNWRHWQLPVMKLITERCPDALKVPNEDGKLPLHNALIQGTREPILELLIDTYPEAMKTMDRNGHLPIYYALSQSQSNQLSAVKLLVRYSPETLALRSDELSRVLLHEAAALGVSVSILDLLIQAHPEATKCMDSHGQLPLHCALASQHAVHQGVALPVLELLLQANPEAPKSADNGGRLPLHCALASHQTLDVIQVLLDTFSGAVLCQDKNGRIPLQVAWESDASLDILFALISQAPDLPFMRN